MRQARGGGRLAKRREIGKEAMDEGSGVEAVGEILPFVVFLYGTLAGFLMFRLSGRNELRAGEERVLVAAGWTMTALSLTLAAALLAFVVARNFFAIG
jgi:hypothetical protein